MKDKAYGIVVNEVSRDAKDPFWNQDSQLIVDISVAQSGNRSFTSRSGANPLGMDDFHSVASQSRNDSMIANNEILPETGREKKKPSEESDDEGEAFFNRQKKAVVKQEAKEPEKNMPTNEKIETKQEINPKIVQASNEAKLKV